MAGACLPVALDLDLIYTTAVLEQDRGRTAQLGLERPGARRSVQDSSQYFSFWGARGGWVSSTRPRDGFTTKYSVFFFYLDDVVVFFLCRTALYPNLEIALPAEEIWNIFLGLCDHPTNHPMVTAETPTDSGVVVSIRWMRGRLYTAWHDDGAA